MNLYLIQAGELVWTTDRLRRREVGAEWIAVRAASLDEALELAEWWDSVATRELCDELYEAFRAGGPSAVADRVAELRGTRDA